MIQNPFKLKFLVFMDVKEIGGGKIGNSTVNGKNGTGTQ
jgi:hypothetical protein